MIIDGDNYDIGASKLVTDTHTRDVSEVAQNGAKTVRWYNYSRAL